MSDIEMWGKRIKPVVGAKTTIKIITQLKATRSALDKAIKTLNALKVGKTQGA